MRPSVWLALWRLIQRGRTLINPRVLLGVAPVLVFALLREVAGTEAAIVGGFLASVIALALNWRHGRAVSALVSVSLAIVAICTVAGLVAEDERVYLTSDPLLDFLMASIFLGSIIRRRPLVGAIAREAIPRLRLHLDDRDRAFYLATLCAVVMNLVQGSARLTLLSSAPVGEYLFLGLAVQWSSGLLMLLASGWLISRAIRAEGVGLRDLFAASHGDAREQQPLAR